MSLVTANNLINTWNLNGGSLDADFVDTIQGLIVDIDFVYSLPNITGLGNEAIILEDTSLGAIPLNLLSGITSGAIDASSISTLTGAAEDLNTAYDSNGITGLNNENVTLSDTTLDAAVLNTLDGNTAGTIDASSVTTLTGAAADLNTAYTANDNGSISGLSNEDVTLSDTTLDAAVLNTLDGNTSGAIDASSINTLTGAADDLINAFASNGITGLGDEAVNVDSGTATTDQANTLATATSAVVTATLSDGDLETLADLNETGNAYTITITDTSADAAALNTLDGKTTVAINAANVNTLTGAADDLITAYASNGITGLDDEDITLSDTSLAVSILNTLDGNTSGTIDASSINTLTGAAADLNTAYAANDNGSISGLSNEDVTLSDTTLDVSVLNTLDGNTSGTIDASSITALSGAADDLNTAYTANDNGSISGLEDEDVTLTDTTLDASVLNTLDGHTSGAIDASSINTLTGAADDLINAFASNGITGLGDEAVNVSSGTATTDQVNTPLTPHPLLSPPPSLMATWLHLRWPQRNRQRLLHHHHGHLR